MSAEPNRLEWDLSDTWDSLIAGDEPGATSLEPEIVSILRALQAIERPAPISVALERDIWSQVIGGTADLWRPAPVVRGGRSWSGWVMLLAWIVAAGFIGGFIAGVGSRLTMRLAGFLTDDRNRFRLTENGNRVGELTFDGTLFLGLVAGALGIVACAIYVLARSRLPFTGWRRSATYSIGLLLVFGYVIMDPSNEDYHLFGPAWMNVVTFSSLYLVMGFCVAQTYEWGEKRAVSQRVLRWQSAIRMPIIGAAGVLVAIGGLFMASAMIVGAPGLPVAVISLAAWLGNRYALGDRIARWPAPAMVRAWGLLILPGILGVILTARGVVGILLN